MSPLLFAFVVLLSAQTPGKTAPDPVARMRADATAMESLVASPLAKSFLAGVRCLPAVEPRVVYYNKTTRDALTGDAAAAMTPAELEGYERKDLGGTFYYFTRYGTPVAFVRPLEILGRAGLMGANGIKIADFGFGSIGQLRVLAGLGADAVGIDVDPLLKAVYSQKGDTGRMKRCASAGRGRGGSVRALYGFFPSDAALVRDVGRGYDVFVSKNTLKRGYIHPAQEVDPRMLVHLNVDDETYVRAVYDLLNPGGYFLIYNLCPAPSKEGEPYKPWSDGRSPFAREVFERAGFQVMSFDQDDTEAARAMGQALGWAEDMDLQHDLFGTYTLVRKPR